MHRHSYTPNLDNQEHEERNWIQQSPPLYSSDEIPSTQDPPFMPGPLVLHFILIRKRD